jgi:hypothetical protein
MNRSRMKPVNSPEEVPDGLSDEDQIRFWETHEITEEFLAKAELASEDERPRSRTTPITVRFDDFTLGRLKDLAESRNVGYQTLLKELVIERLYEEERRQGALPAGQVPDAESVEESSAGEEQETTKPRDWQSEAYDFVKKNKNIIEDEDLDYIVSARLLKDGSSLLLEISNEIKAASRRDKFPPARLKRMMKGYNKLEEFVTKAFEVHEAKFGLPESNEVESPEQNPEQNRVQEEQSAREQPRQFEQQGDETTPVTSLETFKKAKLNRAAASGLTG